MVVGFNVSFIVSLAFWVFVLAFLLWVSSMDLTFWALTLRALTLRALTLWVLTLWG